ncbi:AfsR/SARP family transcriptional regulator (plasmid) [Streptomyces sp. BI20]|uniref:AfsR/SARP family transcriptional regulator n=1 Tax=Streptomyces sp. BI20 TaxID=3403460 RepID=UPI003C71C86B
MTHLAPEPTGTPVRLGVLGPLSLVVDGEDRTPSAPKPRRLLALLMLNANRTVHACDCITELWGSDPPKTAVSTLQTYVLCIRQILRDTTDHSHTLVTRNQGYQLTVYPEASDRLRFEHLARRGLDASIGGEPAVASALLARALDVWRGPVLADVPHGTLSSAHVVHLEEARSSVLQWRIEADLGLGRHRELLDELEGLAAAHPTHENVQAQFMLALHRSGLSDRALAVYRGLHDRLGDTFGIEPVPRLRRLYEAIAADDPVLTTPPATLSRGTVFLQ